MERCRHGLLAGSCGTCQAPSRRGVVSSSARRSGLNDQTPFGPPPAAGPCQFLTRAGKPCQNLGRYWISGRWSCSRNHQTS